jgi:hypothetical protein
MADVCIDCFYWQGEPGALESKCFVTKELVTHDHSCGDFTPCPAIQPASPPPPEYPEVWFKGEGKE